MASLPKQGIAMKMNCFRRLCADRLGSCERRECELCGVTEMIFSKCLMGEIGRAGFWAIQY